MLTPAQRRAWDALDLGPAWRARVSPAPSSTGGPAESPPVEADLAVTDSQASGPQARPLRIASLGWEALHAEIEACRACVLGGSRHRAVPGAGAQGGRWMLVGEAPGAEEDRQGLPFVGNAGGLLDGMLQAVGLNRERDVYITNVLKCRPPGNRNPEPNEVACCQPFLSRQVALVRPRIIVLMGRFAAQALLGTDASIASLRGRVHSLELSGLKIPAVVTYHPAYLLRNLPDKARAWQDWVLARRTLRAATLESDEGDTAALGA